MNIVYLFPCWQIFWAKVTYYLHTDEGFGIYIYQTKSFSALYTVKYLKRHVIVYQSKE